ncbi:hypothetical protein [Streptacidiphilus anmyonensis]|uniref:hypothetical protein n=1 Tax=Streptacidiphilus anmyonensis TaxID=405782 RepID=UPI0005A7E86D|nr:hypothetical protein [Streptacidiphilus anmyonensis]
MPRRLTVLLVDIADRADAVGVVDGGRVAVVWVLGLGHQAQQAAGAEIGALRGGRVVGCAAQVLHVEARSSQPSVGRADEQARGVLTEPKAPFVLDEVQPRHSARRRDELVDWPCGRDVEPFGGFGDLWCHGRAPVLIVDLVAQIQNPQDTEGWLSVA